LVSKLAALLPRIGRLVGLNRQQLDLSKPDHIRGATRDFRPQLIVNAAAYTAVDQAETDEATARAINAEGVAILAEEGKKIGARLIHYSTDYVFDGTKDSPYKENDLTNLLNTYGRTELEGEEAIRAVGIPHLILRTSWVYATRGRNFLLKILRLATQREELGILADQVGAPTWSRTIAAATSRILAEATERSDIGFSEVSGTDHMTATGATNWHAFASTILKEVNRTPDIPWLSMALNGGPITVRRIVALTTAEYPTPARRPANFPAIDFPVKTNLPN